MLVELISLVKRLLVGQIKSFTTHNMPFYNVQCIVMQMFVLAAVTVSWGHKCVPAETLIQAFLCSLQRHIQEQENKPISDTTRKLYCPCLLLFLYIRRFVYFTLKHINITEGSAIWIENINIVYLPLISDEMWSSQISCGRSLCLTN